MATKVIFGGYFVYYTVQVPQSVSIFECLYTVLIWNGDLETLTYFSGLFIDIYDVCVQYVCTDSKMYSSDCLVNRSVSLDLTELMADMTIRNLPFACKRCIRFSLEFNHLSVCLPIKYF